MGGFLQAIGSDSAASIGTVSAIGADGAYGSSPAPGSGIGASDGGGSAGFLSGLAGDFANIATAVGIGIRASSPPLAQNTGLAGPYGYGGPHYTPTQINPSVAFPGSGGVSLTTLLLLLFGGVVIWLLAHDNGSEGG